MERDREREAAEAVNERMVGFDQAMGVRLIRASRDEVVLEYDVAERHRQPYGIVHGGMHCAVVETACSTGAGLDAIARGRSVVGVENHTSFIRAVRSGRITVKATPITRGRRSQVWEATARDEAGQIVSTGRVRLLCLEPGTELAGKPIRPERGAGSTILDKVVDKLVDIAESEPVTPSTFKEVLLASFFGFFSGFWKGIKFTVKWATLPVWFPVLFVGNLLVSLVETVKLPLAVASKGKTNSKKIGKE